jgi:hypothetical protein
MMAQGILFNERGSILFMVFLCSLFISVLGLTAYYVANTELTEASRKYETTKALYLAEGGIERAVVEITSGAADGWDNEVAGADGEMGTGDDGILSFGEKVDCTSLQGGYETVESNEVTTGDRLNHYLGHYDVRIVDGRRPGESPGKCNRIIIASEGVSTKNAMRRVEAEVELWELQLPPALVYIDDPNMDVDFTGNTSLLDGKDTNPNMTPGPGPHVAAILVPRWENSLQIIEDLKDHQCDQVLGVGNMTGGYPCTPSVKDLGSFNLTGFNLNKFKAKDLPKLETLINNEIPGGNYDGTEMIGAPDNYLITRCTGDIHITGQFDGYGVLIVDGDVDITGQGCWYGVIIVKGKYVKIAGGGNGFHLFGTMLCMGQATLTDMVEFNFYGASQSAYSTYTVNKVRDCVRTVTVSRWRQMVAM